jgi:hypothetical protein
MSGAWTHDRESGAGEVDVSSQLLQAQLDPARQQRRTTTQCDRRNLHDDLVEQPRVGELTGQVSPPTIQTFRSPEAATMSWWTDAMSALVSSISALGTTGSCRCVKTQHGRSYGHFHSA